MHFTIRKTTLQYILSMIFKLISLIRSVTFLISCFIFLFSLAFIKRTPVIDADKPVSSQLRVLTLSEDSPYETLHSFISNAVAPFFKSYIRESGKADR